MKVLNSKDDEHLGDCILHNVNKGLLKHFKNIENLVTLCEQYFLNCQNT
jgi:hypothetical protein